ncbi:MAG: 30S ribosomal protein S4 [Candidatus Altiarchaeota archaeon]
MGDPRKQRKKYTRPTHPWKSERILEENELCKKYGLKNKAEVWRAKSTLKGFRHQARTLLGMPAEDEEVKKETKQLIDKLNRLGIMSSQSLEDVLSLNVEDILERRLQTLVASKGIAHTVGQARQFITHGHIKVGGKVVDVPRYPVYKKEEDTIELVKPLKVAKSA